MAAQKRMPALRTDYGIPSHAGPITNDAVYDGDQGVEAVVGCLLPFGELGQAVCEEHLCNEQLLMLFLELLMLFPELDVVVDEQFERVLDPIETITSVLAAGHGRSSGSFSHAPLTAS